MRVVKYPHPMLSYQSKPIRKIDEKLREVVTEMFQLMYDNQGVGLAANQVNLPYQLVVINPTGNREQKDQEYCFINPVILKFKGGNELGEEGCLSFPELRMIVPRAKEVKFQAVDLNGELHTYFWKGFQARIIQHETDHLFGTCFYQRATESITRDYKALLNKLNDRYNEDLAKGLEPNREQFIEYVAKLECERT